MTTRMNKIAMAIGAMVMASGVWATGDDTGTMAVSASIAAACSVGNGTALNLGSLAMIDANGVQTTADDVLGSTFPAICTNGTSSPTFTYVSANKVTTDFNLLGADGTTKIAYTLYPTSGGTGDALTGGAATAHPSFTANGVSQTLDLSAKVLAAAKAGKLVQAYSDTITITASFGAQ